MMAAHGNWQDVREPKSKRQRIAIACQSCRTRKTRCDGVKPACGTCIDMDFICLYPRPARSTSRYETNDDHVESRLSAMEDALRLLATKATIDTRYNESGTLLAQIQGLMSPQRSSNTTPDASHDFMVVPVDPRSAASDIIVTPKADNQQNDTVDGMVLITFTDESTSAYFGPSSNSAFFAHIDSAIRPLRSLLTQPLPVNGTQDLHSTNVSRPPSPHQDGRSDETRAEDINCFVLPPRGVVLQHINTFFSGFGLLFPYLYAKHFRDVLVETENSALSGVRRSWLCLLNLMMTFAVSGADCSVRQKADAQMFLQRALKLLPDIALKPANLETLQALLLMTQFLQGTQHSARTWTVQGLSVQAAFQIGLHSPAEHAKHTPLEREILNRCWHMCCIMDKTCSMTFGRPQVIPEEMQRIRLPRDVDLCELDGSSSSPQSTLDKPKSSSVAAFIQSIKFYAVLGKILEKVYQNNIQLEGQPTCTVLLNQIMSLEPELAQWRADIPAPLCILSREQFQSAVAMTAADDDVVFSLILTLRYIHARLLLHRPIVTCFLQLDYRDVESNDKDAFLQQFGRASLEACTRSALDMISCLTISVEQNIQGRPATTWWFQIYYAFSAALVIFSAIVINYRHGTQSSASADTALLRGIEDTIRILGKLGPNSRIGNRCRKYLGKIHQRSLLFVHNANRNLDEGQNNNASVPDPSLGLHGIDSLDMDHLVWEDGQFVAEADWANFLQLGLNNTGTWIS